MKLSKQELERIFEVDFDKGVLRWKIRPANCMQIGDMAGSKQSGGYYNLKLCGKNYKLHRIIYQMAYGDLTDKDMIDHIDGDPSNNSLSNLRKCTKSQNQMNRQGAAKNSKTGIRNVQEHVCYRSGKKYWKCRLRRNGKNIFQKYYPQDEYTLVDMANIADQIRQEYFGEFGEN